MFKCWLFLFPFMAFAAFGGCSEDPDEVLDNGNDPSVNEPDGDTTLDGEEAFARFDVAQFEVSARVDVPQDVTLHTNLADPQISIRTDAVEPFVHVAYVTPPDVENDWLCTVGLEVDPNNVSYDSEGRPQASARSATLAVDAGGRTLATMQVLQEAPPFCQLQGDVQSTFSSLSYTFVANKAMTHVRYLLSDRKLSDSDAADNLYDPFLCEELWLDEGQETFTLTFDGLLPSTTYYLYVRPMDQYGNSAELNFYFMLPGTTAAPADDQDLVLHVSANPANGFTVYLPFWNIYTDGIIDWGDGTVEEWHNSGSDLICHKYDVSQATTYDVRFKGTLTHLELNSPAAPVSARENTLLAIVQWGYTGLEDIDLSGFTSLTSVATDTQGAFRKMKNFGVEPYGGSFTDTGITEIPEGFFDYATEVTSFDYTFGGCTRLASLPAGLFKNCKKVKSFQRTFLNCTSLAVLPADLFDCCPDVTTFQTTFSGCTGLTEIPSGLFDACHKVTSFEGTFGGCTGLVSIPSGLFARNTAVSYVGMASYRDAGGGYRGGLGVFEGCTSLAAVPDDLFASFTNLSDASYAFYGCKSLTALPSGLFASATKLEFLENAFQNCTGLVSLPVQLFDNNRQLRVIGELFSGCSNLKGESPYTLVDGVKVHLYEREKYNTQFVAPDDYTWCFRYCTGLDDYDSMSERWK